MGYMRPWQESELGGERREEIKEERRSGELLTRKKGRKEELLTRYRATSPQ